MKSPRGIERVSQPVENLLEEVARRSFHAVAKIIADGLPTSGLLESEAWRAPTISRALTDQEAEVAARIAIWIEDAAKDLTRRVLSESLEVSSKTVKAWLSKDADLKKYSKGLSTNKGRLEGANTNKEKAKEAKGAWAPVISAKRKEHPTKGKKAIYDFIAKDIAAGKHSGIKDLWPSFETAKSWIPARNKKTV